MERLLENKICVITGAAQGIGREIARRFAADGAIVYACDRQEFTSEHERIHPIVFDITDAAAVRTAVMQIFKEAGRIDVLVNNAGVVFNRKIGMITREETELMFRINVIAVLELIQLVSRLMARNGGAASSISLPSQPCWDLRGKWRTRRQRVPSSRLLSPPPKNWRRKVLE